MYIPHTSYEVKIGGISSHLYYKLKYAFPLKPYDIQMHISTKIYSALDLYKTKFMIIESPTGTGKSFSLLVPILAWLSENKYKIKAKKPVYSENIYKKKIPSFLIKRNTGAYSYEIKQQKMKKKRYTKEASIIDIEEIAKSHKTKFKITASTSKKQEETNFFDDLDLDNFDDKKISQDFLKRQVSKYQRFIEKYINLERYDIPVKLIFVSRTHSQLYQIVKATEYIKLKIKSYERYYLLALSLGSKELLCCNPDIKKPTVTYTQSISYKCQYLLDHSTCPYSHSHVIKQFLGKSINEAKTLSYTHKLCGYYGLKNFIDCADVLYVPYSSLVNPYIRSKIGININNSIIVFDEGHNLMEFIKNSSSSEIFYFEVLALTYKLAAYLYKYGQKMKSQNKNTLYHFNYVLQSISGSMNLFYSQKYVFFLLKRFSNNDQSYLSLSVLDLIVDLNIKDLRMHKILNLFYLLDYDKKVAFFESEPKLKTHHKINNSNMISIGQVRKIIDWINMLFRLSSYKIIILVKSNQYKGEKNVNNMSFKLFCLYSEELYNIIESSRMTICAGGTMEPLSDFEQIFSKSFCHEIVKVGHIINPSQCKIFCINKYENKYVKFYHQNLSSYNYTKFLQKVIALTLKKIVASTPIHEGIIVFIQSYKLLSLLKYSLGKEEFFYSILFDSQKSENENIFQTHSQKLSAHKRSILISVMGGKLSYGINFSDNLARKLIVFGLPYPNVKSPYIVYQMKYYDYSKLPNFNGQVFYYSLCLKAINQTIGRAIRHKNDWADIFLVDSRFENVKGKLSYWMKKSIKVLYHLYNLDQFTKK